MNKRKTTLPVICLCLALAASVIMLQGKMSAYQDIRFIDQRPVFLPRGEVVKWLSMGHRGLVADWLWIQCVLYYGRRVIDEDNAYYRFAVREGTLEQELSRYEKENQAVAKPTTGLRAELAHLLYQTENKALVAYIYPMLDRITTVDPHFIFPYIYGGVYVLLDTGDVDAAVALLKKGHRLNPGRWELPFYLGWLHWMYMDNKERTVAYLQKAIALKGCPRFAGDLLIHLSADLGRSEMNRRYLEGLLLSTDNPEIKEKVRELLQRGSAFYQ
jgi:tetratricopeptide (TPR) repeat protein